MSNDAINWAWKAKVGGAKLVLICLADHATDHSGEDWACYPSVERLVARTEMSRSTVERWLRWLDAEGYVTRQRRIRPDRRLGIFDYTLHRDEETRARLKAERSGEPQVKMTCGEEGEPQVNLTCGEGSEPQVNLTRATGQNDVEPQVKLTAQEPLEEPLVKPTGRVRDGEPGDDGFSTVESLWPIRGLERTDYPAARAQVARWSDELGADVLVEAIRRAVASGKLDRGDHGAPGIHNWLRAERFRPWLGEGSGVVEAGAPSAAPSWAGSSAMRRAFVVHFGEGKAGAYLDRATWREADRVLIPATGVAFDFFNRDARWLLREHDVRLVAPDAAGQVQA